MAEPFHTLQDDESVLEMIKCTDAALQKAADELKAAQEKVAQYEAKNKEIDALIPQVVDALVEHERIAPNQKEKAAAHLKDPIRALETLVSAADPSNTVRPRPIGAKDTVKTAAARKPTPGEEFDRILGYGSGSR